MNNQMEVHGDIVDIVLDKASDKNVHVKVLHVANCEHVMGAGVAKRLRIAWPIVYNADLASPLHMAKMGTSSVAHVDDNITVYNMYAQAFPGKARSPFDPIGYSLQRAIRYDALESCLLNVRHTLVPHDVLMYPMFGAGLAGGDWGVIQAIIDSVFKYIDIERILIIYQ